jgi:hypothetical protein
VRKKIIGVNVGVARFFLVHDTETGKNVPNVRKIFQIAINISTCSNLRPSKFPQIGIF